MTETPAENRIPTSDEVDDAVEAWHGTDWQSTPSIEEYFGWSIEEYSDWVRDPNQIPQRPLACADQVRAFKELKRKLAPYALPLRTDVQNIPFDAQVILLGKENEHLAIGIRQSDYEPDQVSVILGFDRSAYGWYTPIDDILAWYPVLKKHLPDCEGLRPDEIRERRYQVAQEAYESFQFREGLEVKDHGGWGDSGETDELNREVYLESSNPSEEEIEEGTSIPVTFVVKFMPNSARIDKVYAYNASGNDMGTPGDISA